MGIESATEMGLLTLDRHQTVGQSVRALDICGELDISAQFTIMTFNPDANLKHARADLALMRRFAGNPLNFCRAEIYAGTPLEKRMIALGRARGDYRAREYSMYDPVADLACTISLDLFHDRCWGDGSLIAEDDWARPHDRRAEAVFTAATTCASGHTRGCVR